MLLNETQEEIRNMARDFSPIVQVTTQPYVIVVNPNVPVKSIAELIAYAKANPGKLNYASFGIGSIAHMAGELFKQASKTDIVHIA